MSTTLAPVKSFSVTLVIVKFARKSGVSENFLFITQAPVKEFVRNFGDS